MVTSGGPVPDPVMQARAVLLEHARRLGEAGGLPEVTTRALVHIAETGNLAAICPAVQMTGAWEALAGHARAQADLQQAEGAAGTVPWTVGCALRSFALEYDALIDADRVAGPGWRTKLGG